MTFKPMERFWEKNYQGEYLLAKEVHYGRDPIVQRLIYNAYIFRKKPAIIYYGTEFTWTELKDMVLKVAGGLQRLGVKVIGYTWVCRTALSSYSAILPFMPWVR